MRTALTPIDFAQQLEAVTPLMSGFDYLREPVIITDAAANILYANSAMMKHSGYSRTEILGRNPADIWGGKMPQEFYEAMWRTIRYEKRSFVGEVQNMRKDSAPQWAELHITPVLGARGDVEHFIGVSIDITDRKRQQQFRDEFASIVGHQLRDPLAAIMLMLELLRSDNHLTPQERDTIASIYAMHLDLTDLVQDLLAVSRMNTIDSKTELVFLEQVLVEAVRDAKLRRAACTFSVDASGAFPLLTNKTLVSQIFHNIITNAAEYAGHEQPHVSVRLLRDVSGTLFTCRDDGIGIADEDKRKIFSKAFRSRDARTAKSHGAGLGLFIVKMIVDSLGWSIWFESERGRGTTFYVRIPNAT